ncbi:MAG: glycoside hydrolase family protein [Caulobacteraceae bacterium]|nr:glycoside hydrolase family protein [Caulobacteraceae bacterium]
MDTPRHHASRVAIDLIKRFEGYRRDAAQLPDGRWTIGHGHTRSAREGASVSPDDAEALLIYDLDAVAAAIDAAVFTPLSQNQFDALASFVFNIGIENFRHSAVLRRINEGAVLEAAFTLEMWRKADFGGERIVVDALVRRRAAEKALFLTPQGGFVPAPSSVVEPKADFGLDIGAPLEPAAELTLPLEGPLAAPLPADGDEASSPSQRAAANLAARLKALLPEAEEAPREPEPAALGEAAPSVPPGPEPGAGSGPESGLEFGPEPEPFPTLGALVAEAPHEPAPFAAEPSAQAATDPETLRRVIFGKPEPKPAPKRWLGGVWPLALLGGAGLAVFVGAIVWAFRAKPPGAGAPLGVGVVLVGFIGILCVASAVYFFLEGLAGRDI